MYTAVLTLHIIVAIIITGLILIQHGKGADAGASFGAGSAGTVFGATGSANFLTRTTAVLAAIFFITSLTLAGFARREAQNQLTLDVPTANSTPLMPMPSSSPTPAPITTDTPTPTASDIASSEPPQAATTGGQ